MSRAGLAGLVAFAATAASGNGRVPTTAILSPEATLVAAQENGPIHVWERASGRKIAELPAETWFRGSLARGALVAVAEGGVALFRGARFELRRKLALPKVLNVARTAVSADGARVAALYTAEGSVGDPRTVRVWDGRTGRILSTVTLRRGRGQGLVLAEDGSSLAILGDEPRERLALLEIHALDGPRMRLRVRWQSRLDETTFSGAFSPRGDRFALGAGARLLLFEVASGKLLTAVEVSKLLDLFPAQLRRLPFRFPGAHQVVFSRDGTSLATLHATGVVGVGVWQAPSLTPRRWVKRHLASAPVRQLAWDAEGRLFAVATTYSPTVTLLVAREGDFRRSGSLSP